jgi:hypothetical protein
VCRSWRTGRSTFLLVQRHNRNGQAVCSPPCVLGRLGHWHRSPPSAHVRVCLRSVIAVPRCAVHSCQTHSNHTRKSPFIHCSLFVTDDLITHAADASAGSGKSTLLNTLALRLDRAVSLTGELRLNGRAYDNAELKRMRCVLRNQLSNDAWYIYMYMYMWRIHVYLWLTHVYMAVHAHARYLIDDAVHARCAMCLQDRAPV